MILVLSHDITFIPNFMKIRTDIKNYEMHRNGKSCERKVRLVRWGQWFACAENYAHWCHHHSTSRIHSTITLLLRMAGNKRIWFLSCHIWHKVHTKFRENPYRYYKVMECTQAGIIVNMRG
jgi:hypothetical protein